MQKDSVNDLELNLKKRARRRLVGAIALVLLMFITLPFLLKDRAAPQPQAQITITLPGEQPSTIPATNPSDFDSSVMPSAPVADTPEDGAPIADEAPIIDTEAASNVAKKTVTIEVKPEETKPVEANSDEAKPAQAKPKVSLPKEAESKPIPTPTPEKAAPAKTAEKEAVKPKAESSHKFYVQVGVFSDEENVKKLQAKLSDLGYKSQTEKIDTANGKKIRLRTQMFGDRNEAAIALENIKDAGLVGMVVSQ